MLLFNQSEAISGFQNQVNKVVSSFENTWRAQENNASSSYQSNINYKNDTIAKARAIVSQAKQNIQNFVNSLKYTKSAASQAESTVFSSLDQLLNEFIAKINKVPVPVPKPSPTIYHPITPTVTKDLDSYLNRIGLRW